MGDGGGVLVGDTLFMDVLELHERVSCDELVEVAVRGKNHRMFRVKQGISES